MNERWRVIEGDTSALAAPPLEADETAVRLWREPLTEAGHRAVARLLARRPEARLWISHPVEDLELLRHFAGLRRLTVESLRLRSWAGVRHVADSLADVDMGETTLRPISIAPLGELPRLTALGLNGPVRDADVIARLEGLTDLHLRSVTLPDLSSLLPMRRLRRLYIGLGGTSDLRLLPELARIEELELWRIRGLEDLSMLGRLPALRELRLQSMSRVRQLPSFRAAAALRLVALDTMPGITDLAPLAEAPALEELLLVAMNHLEPEALRPLVGHPTLRRGIWGLGSDRKNGEAWELLPLGDPPYNYDRWQARKARLTRKA